MSTEKETTETRLITQKNISRRGTYHGAKTGRGQVGARDGDVGQFGDSCIGGISWWLVVGVGGVQGNVVVLGRFRVFCERELARDALVHIELLALLDIGREAVDTPDSVDLELALGQGIFTLLEGLVRRNTVAATGDARSNHTGVQSDTDSATDNSQLGTRRDRDEADLVAELSLDSAVEVVGRTESSDQEDSRAVLGLG